MLAIAMWKYKQVASAKALLLNIESCLYYAMTTFSHVTHVIFDLDGLILDSEKVYKAKYEELLARYGKTLSDELRLSCLGRKDVDCARAIIEATNIPLTTAQWLTEVKKLQIEGMINTTLMPGVERLVRHLSHYGVPLAVATSSSQESVELKISKHKKFMSLFHHIVMAGSDPEVKHGKPSPDVFLVCAARFPDKPSPEKCLVLEDAHNGVQAAIAAGMQVVMVPDSSVPTELTKEATIVLKSLKDFCPEMFGLPKFSNNSK
ncbi:pseudouridine-5'-phosphatase-like [Homalodisca vitripennis]|uniref:pseudouridine-5'-phosphatase-like n=1 Tax=Homalodisca vitripennis TaxID=197043 RepID=UPI001EEB1755|nr:pseudouridine-5'-phosphatase-like [Homalodisca vitripennis]XP_046669001.1 pseudouridine-5'-phosphatase-like [Homalodisca vitripennis]